MPLGNPIRKQNESRVVSVLATEGQSVFTVQGGYIINQISVFRNGVRLSNSEDFTAGDGSTVTLNNQANIDDRIEFHIFDRFTVQNAIVGAASSQTISGDVVVNGKIFGNLDVPSVNTGIVTATNLNISGISTFANVDFSNLDISGITTTRGLSIFGNTTGLNVASGISTFQAVTGTTGTFTGDVDIADKIVHTGDTNTAIRFPSADTITAETSGTEAIRINNSGQFLVGVTAARTMLSGYTPSLQVEGTANSDSSVSIVENISAASGPSLWFGKTRGNSLGANTVVQSGDELGTIVFNGADGTDVQSMAAFIRASVDGTPGSNDMPGRITIHTTADGAASPTERMRITSDGNIGFNVTPTNYSNYVTLALNDTTGSTIEGRVGGTLTGSFTVDSLVTINAVTSIPIVFKTANTERMRIKSNGELHIATTSGNEKLNVAGAIRSSGSSANFSAGLEGTLVDFDTGNNLARLGHVNGASGSARSVVFLTGGVEKMRLDSSGNFLVGTTTQAGKFTVDSGTSNTVATFQSSDAGAGVNLKDDSARSSLEQNGTDLKISSDTGGEHANSTIKLQVDGATKMLVDSNGKVGIGENTPLAQLHIKPPSNMSQLLLEQNNATDGYALFQDGPNGGHLKFLRHVGGSDTQTLLLRNGGGLCFGTDSAAANALDDYEEGNFTPTLYYVSGTSGVQIAIQQGRYTKVGRLVSFQLRLQLSNKGSGTNNIRIGGLPFTPSTSGLDYDYFIITAVVGMNLGSAGKVPFAQMEDYSTGRITLYSFDYSSGTNYNVIGSSEITDSFYIGISGNYVTAT